MAVMLGIGKQRIIIFGNNIMTTNTNSKTDKRLALILLSVAIIIVAVVFCFNKLVVADYVNAHDFILSPIKHNGKLYFHSGKAYDENTYEKIGYLLDKNSVLEVMLCMFFANELYAIDGDRDHLRSVHVTAGSYSAFSVFENKEYTDMIFNKYEEFELLFKDEMGEFFIGSLDIPKDIVVSLEEQLGDVNYKISDFNKSDKNYYVYVKSPNKDPFDLKEDSFLYIGVIMAKDGNYYYGNLSNQIGQEQADAIKAALN